MAQAITRSPLTFSVRPKNPHRATDNQPPRNSRDACVLTSSISTYTRYLMTLTSAAS
jgi:hypothetical protein